MDVQGQYEYYSKPKLFINNVFDDKLCRNYMKYSHVLRTIPTNFVSFAFESQLFILRKNENKNKLRSKCSDTAQPEFLHIAFITFLALLFINFDSLLTLQSLLFKQEYYKQ